MDYRPTSSRKNRGKDLHDLVVGKDFLGMNDNIYQRKTTSKIEYKIKTVKLPMK